MSVLNNSLLLGQEGGAGYIVQRSVRFNVSDSAYLSRTPASAGNRKTWTWAAWVKRSGLGSNQTLFSAGPLNGSGNPTGLVSLYFADTDRLTLICWTGSSSNVNITSSAVFRDSSAWYHVAAVLDTDNATTGDRLRLYVNGSRITDFSSASYPSSGATFSASNTEAHNIGRYVWSSDQYANGYLADVHFIDGQALTPSSFTEVSATTGQLIPKAYTGTFGTNGFWLKFSDNSAATATTLGKDYSGNGNNWTPNNLSVTAGTGNDSLVDTPSSAGTDTGVGGVVTGNYCTWNPLDAHSSLTITNGNLDLSNTAGTTRNVRGTIGFPSSGKWYYEVTPGGSVQGAIGIGSSAVPFNAQNAASSVTYFEDGSKGVDASRTAYGSSYASGDVIGIAFNADTNQVTFYKNGVSQGALSTTAGVQYFPFIVTFNATYSANFGQRTFAYPVSGFKCLCDTSLPSPVVAKSSTVMDVKLYTGNGSTQTISGLGFSPDLVWIKSRSLTVGHLLADSVRGIDKSLYANSTDLEDAYKSNGYVSATSSTGFTVAPGTTDATVVNQNSATYAAWAWDAGSTTVTDTTGSIQSSRRTNASAGISIVTYTGNGVNGASIGHGLGVAPHMIISKSRSNSNTSWGVFHKSLGAGKNIWLDLTLAASTGNTWWYGVDPTSTVTYVGAGSNETNQNGWTFVHYCFAPVAGHSSAFSIIGNGSSDGPFCFLGFRPRFIIYKRTDAAANWRVLDTARDTYNVASAELYPSLSNAEQSFAALDILSNGFKLRNTDASYNASGGTYVGFAWAENPFQYARAR